MDREIITGRHTGIEDTDYSNRNWTTYFLFGLNLVSDFRLVNRVAALGIDAPDLSFTCTVVESLPVDWTEVTPNYISPYKTMDGESILYVYRQPQCDVLHFTDVGEFYVWPDRIECYRLQSAYNYQVETWLVGAVLSLWIERRGRPVMHASAVVIEDRAIVFLAGNTAGKSSLAAALMQSGYPLLTDDALPIALCGETVIGQPGYPRMRLWPDLAEHFLGHFEDLELIHPEASKRNVPVGPEGFGSFCDVPRSISCLYIPVRRDPETEGTAVEIKPVSPRDATLELVRYSFLTRILAGLGMQPQRFGYLAQIAGRVPMRRVIYPSGMEHLPRVREKILEDAKAWHY